VIAEVREEFENRLGRGRDGGGRFDLRRGFAHDMNVSLRAVGTEAFESIAGRIDYPMFIATTVAGDGERSGCLVGFTTQCSINPARYLVCISDKNHTYRVVQRAKSMAVHLVPENGDEIAALFGGETEDATDKFEQCAWHAGPDGLPLIDVCPNWFAGRILDRVPLGDHVGHVLDPFAGQDPAPELGWYPFSRAKGIEPGHEA
jgi:flavin reductase (DIM6/NTAB) family NADH-FMN oxidoreductase RutF